MTMFPAFTAPKHHFEIAPDEIEGGIYKYAKHLLSHVQSTYDTKTKCSHQRIQLTPDPTVAAMSDESDIWGLAQWVEETIKAIDAVYDREKDKPFVPERKTSIIGGMYSTLIAKSQVAVEIDRTYQQFRPLPTAATAAIRRCRNNSTRPRAHKSYRYFLHHPPASVMVL